MVLRKLSQTLKVTLALMLSVLSSGILQVAPAYAYSTEPNPDPSLNKVWVCKYVGTPGINEALKNGNDGLVSTAVASIPDPENDGVHLGDKFSDRHDHSVVIAWDDKGDKPSANLCPAVNNGGNEVTPLPAGISDVCGADNDQVPSEDTNTYEVTDDSMWVNNSRTITYEATSNLVFSESDGWTVSADGKTATYTYKDWATACPTGPAGSLNIDTACEEITLGSTIIMPLGGTVTYEIDDASATAGANTVNPGAHKVELLVNGTEVDEKTVAIERCVTECTLTNNTYLEPWMYEGFTYPDVADYEVSGLNVENNATYEFKANGLHLSTPDKASSVYGLISAGNTPLVDVDAMSYETFRKNESAGYAGTHPAYILVVDTNGTAVADGEKYFFYEPYNNATNAATEDAWHIWDTLNSGNAKWWMSGTGQALHTWNYFVAEYPDAVVLAYGFNQGTSNAETFSIVQDIEFDCATTSFSKGNVLPVDDTNTPPTPTTPTPQTPTTPGKVLSTSTNIPATLPATGGSTSPFTIIIASLMAYGAAYFLQGRRLLARNEA